MPGGAAAVPGIGLSRDLGGQGAMKMGAFLASTLAAAQAYAAAALASAETLAMQANSASEDDGLLYSQKAGDEVGYQLRRFLLSGCDSDPR